MKRALRHHVRRIFNQSQVRLGHIGVDGFQEAVVSRLLLQERAQPRDGVGRLT
jgi:hypothetical protein